jgi:chromosome partitioning protein
MKTLTLLNEKGGVGKTTLATHIAAGLAIRGKRVVLVDADPQGHATVALGLAKEPMLHDLIVRDLPFQSALRRAAHEVYGVTGKITGDLLVIPTDNSARVIPLMTQDNPMAMRNRFIELDRVIDYLIFDTAPTPSLLHSSIYMATDAILYPTKCEYLSFDGLIESLKRREEASRARKHNGLPEVVIGGIIPTMYRSGTSADDYGLEILREHYGSQVWTPLPLRTVWNQASFARRLLFSFAPDSKATEEVWQVVELVEAI